MVYITVSVEYPNPNTNHNPFSTKSYENHLKNVKVTISAANHENNHIITKYVVQL